MPKKILEYKEKNYRWGLTYCEDSDKVEFTSGAWVLEDVPEHAKITLDRLNALDNWFSQQAIRANRLIEKHGFDNLAFKTSIDKSVCSLAIEVRPPTKVPLTFHKDKVLLLNGNTLKEIPMEKEDWNTVQEIYERYTE